MIFPYYVRYPIGSLSIDCCTRKENGQIVRLQSGLEAQKVAEQCTEQERERERETTLLYTQLTTMWPL